jgi:hypothetical protein
LWIAIGAQPFPSLLLMGIGTVSSIKTIEQIETIGSFQEWQTNGYIWTLDESLT